MSEWKFFFYFILFKFSFQVFAFVARSVKEPIPLEFTSPTTSFPPHAFSSSKTLSFPDFHSTNLFPLSLFIFVDLIEEVRSG